MQSLDNDLSNPFTLSFSPVFAESPDEATFQKGCTALQTLPLAFTFDSKKKKFALQHEVREVKAFVTALKLHDVFSSNLSPLESPLGITLCHDSSESLYTITAGCTQKFARRLSQLQQRAIVWMQQRVIPPYIRVSPQITTPHDLLAINQGVIIGEIHSDTAARQYLIQNIQQIAAFGVKTLFLEHFCYDSFQDILDEYHQQQASDLQSPLNEFVSALDNSFRSTIGFGYKELLIAAKTANIRVVGLDTTVSYSAGVHRKLGVENSHDRYLAMNYVAVRIIEKEQQTQQKKYVALIGSGHVSTVADIKIPGIAELLGLPSAVIETGKTQERISKTNVTMLHKKITQVGMYITLPKNTEDTTKQPKVEKITSPSSKE